MGGRLLAACVLAAVGCGSAAAPTAADGVLDLSGWRPSDGPVRLAGDWRMYWHRFVDDGAADPGPPDSVVPLRIWNGMPLTDGTRATPFGWATYRVSVRLPAWAKSGQESLAVHLLEASSAYRLVVRDTSGRLLASFESGRISSDAQHSVPRRLPGTLRFNPTDDLIVTEQVSNWEHGRGGPWAVPLIGRTWEVDRGLRRELVLDFIVIGVLLIIAGHNLAMFALRRRDQAPLWFAVACILLTVRALVVRRYPDAAWPEGWSWLFGLRLEYLSFYLAVPALALFFRALFQHDVGRRFVTALTAVFVVTSLVVMVTPARVFTQTLTMIQIGTVVCLGWAFYQMGRLIRRGNRLALIMLFGFTLLAGTTIYDILFSRNVFNGGYASHYGISGFVFVQSLILAVVNERARRELEARNRDVLLLNETLRQSIGVRSRELQEALQLLEAHTDRSEIEPGHVLAGRYRIDRVLGAGGMGLVYEASRLTDGARVAVKMLRGPWGRDKLARFAREAELATRVVHPNVITLFDFAVTDDGECYLAMELVEGGSLEQRRDQFGAVAGALPILRQLAGALAAIHRAGIVHRDLKPANILMAGELVKVGDFGIAGLRVWSLASQVRFGAALAETVPEDPELTAPGAFLGSPRYMAPELAGGAERASSRSDVFSFGLIAFELLTGARAFEDPPVIARAEGRDIPPAPPFYGKAPSLSREVAELLDRCLWLEPSGRPTAGELLEVLGG